jgi:hypothetical protein
MYQNSDDVKNIKKTIRLSKNEYKKIEQKMEEMGIKNISSFIREVLKKEIDGGKTLFSV